MTLPPELPFAPGVIGGSLQSLEKQVGVRRDHFDHLLPEKQHVDYSMVNNHES